MGRSISNLLHLSPFEATLSYWLVPLGTPAGLYTVLLSLVHISFPLSLGFRSLSLGPLIHPVPPSPPPVPTICCSSRGISKETDMRVIDLLPVATKCMPKQSFLMLLGFDLSKETQAYCRWNVVFELQLFFIKHECL